MEQSLLRLVLGTLAEHSESCQSYPYSQYPNRQLFDPRLVDCSAPTNLPDVTSYVSTLALPTPLSRELNSLLEDDLNKDRLTIEQAYRRLVEQLSTTTTSPDPSTVPSHVRAALDAFCQRLINSRMNTIKQEIEAFKLEGDSESESDGSDESDEESVCSDEDEAEELADAADEDDNAPVRPGEDIPPLDTKYLPIFEALHERGKVLTKPEKTYLVEMTGMTYRQITIWFQNRRRGELKEDHHARPSSSRAASVHSDRTSEGSEDGLELEQRFSSIQPDTTFNIRSWCLASAAATKDAPAPPPLSPLKFGFGPVQAAPAFESDDDTDLSDSDDEMAPPGLHAPSLATSFTTVDSGSDRGPATVVSGSSRLQPGSNEGPIIMGDSSSSADAPTFRRPVKPLPPSRRTSPQARGPAPVQQAPAFSFNFAGSASAPAQNQFLPTSAPMPAQPAQFVTSNERGLTVEMDNTPPTSATTLQSSSSPSAPTSFANTSMPVVLPSSPPLSAGSPHSASSPTPPAQSATSPRPAIKPLPRRTGCAPRPRPPPRAGSVSTPAASTVAPSSARSSVVLPPSSNPSLGNTTLGALLRPNPPAPKIPVEMEDRLSAMAGRMGVGSNPNPARRGTTSDTAALARTGAPPGTGTFPSRGPSFSFGPPMLPGASAMPGSTLAPITGQQAQGAAVRSPTSS
ncbi:hypothetical protein BDV93DRAFT_522900 [Ceratobasidium sp. AG-I]|nr:hypothetical protein BDV93DRAFT_522900 [Ceratobasidium sp. AG-I]